MMLYLIPTWNGITQLLEIQKVKAFTIGIICYYKNHEHCSILQGHALTFYLVKWVILIFQNIISMIFVFADVGIG